MTSVRPVISSQLVLENVPAGGAWEIACECGERLRFSYRDRGTMANTLVVEHGEPGSEARWELPGACDANLLWAIGVDDPLARWLRGVHDYEDER